MVVQQDPIHDASIPVSTQRILVVDDESMILDIYLEILEKMGHQVDTASDGLEAFRKIEENDYSLIISDLKMPKMDGIELFHKVLNLKPQLEKKFIFATGDASYMSSYEFIHLSEVPYLVKPISVKDIEDTIRNSFTR